MVIPGAGGYYDPAAQIGLATVTAPMMREGTRRRTTAQMSQSLETHGGHRRRVAPARRARRPRSAAVALTEHFDQLFEIAADILLNPTFPADEWDR